MRYAAVCILAALFPLMTAGVDAGADTPYATNGCHVVCSDADTNYPTYEPPTSYPVLGPTSNSPTTYPVLGPASNSPTRFGWLPNGCHVVCSDSMSSQKQKRDADAASAQAQHPTSATVTIISLYVASSVTGIAGIVVGIVMGRMSNKPRSTTDHTPDCDEEVAQPQPVLVSL